MSDAYDSADFISPDVLPRIVVPATHSGADDGEGASLSVHSSLASPEVNDALPGSHLPLRPYTLSAENAKTLRSIFAPPVVVRRKKRTEGTPGGSGSRSRSRTRRDFAGEYVSEVRAVCAFVCVCVRVCACAHVIMSPTKVTFI